MKVALLQLCDIHIKSKKEENPIFKKAEFICKAIQNEVMGIKKIFFLITGDVAFSGKEEEYLLAIDLFQDIREKMFEATKLLPEFILTPGNHDCNHSKNSAVRKMVINSLRTYGMDTVDEEIIQQLCATQENFFQFNSLFENNESIIFENKLIKINRFEVGDFSLVFHSYNTSWFSELHEQPGKMIYPIQLFPKDIEASKGDVVISQFHHPVNWLDPMNALAFRQHVEEQSDIILTGHEHHPAFSIRDTLDGNLTQYVEGGVLQDNYNPDNSQFNLIVLDIENRKQKLSKYVWNGELYSQYQINSDWIDFRSSNKARKTFKINDNFKEHLLSNGSNFQNQNKSKIFLEDIFVYPDLKEINIDDNDDSKGSANIIQGSDLFNDINNFKKIILLGDDKSGKTSLCKVLFHKLYKIKYVPVLIEGLMFNNTKIEDINKLIMKQFELQYSKDLKEQFQQLENDKKVIIIDDFHKARMNSLNRKKLLTELNKYYPQIIITANSLFKFEEFLFEDSNISAYFKTYEIMEFGNVLRSKLIYKWNSIGLLPNVENNELLAKHDNNKRLVDTVIGYNYVPSYPFFLLIILQAADAGTPHNLTESSYGYYYDILIKTTLQNINIRNEEMDAYNSYITELAYYFFDKKLSEISKSELLQFHKWFCNEFDIYHDFNSYISKLVEVSILDGYNDTYKFRYKYIYYYFVAQFIANNITSEEIRNVVSKMCKYLHIEEIANIVMFLTHKSKDPFILQEILTNAKEIFSEFSEARLEKDMLMNKLISEGPRLILLKRDAFKVREEQYKEQDSLEMSLRDKDEEYEGYFNIDEEPEELDIIAKLNRAFKTIEIIGQVLKNYYGSIKGDKKYELCLEAYNIGLRSLNSFFSLIEANLEAIVRTIQERVTQKDFSEKDANRIVFQICCMFCYLFIKKVSSSVGSDNLSETFKRILESNYSPAVELIDIAIKLDHQRSLPHLDIRRMKQNFEGNLLAYTLLRKMVLDYLYMFDVDYRTKHKICDALNISIDRQLAIDITSTQKKG
jgi:UDP-2,3-diacylglucosamine pyrophosphatase LpxH